MRSTNVVSAQDVHREITDRIVAMIEMGACRFEMPWHSQGTVRRRPVNAQSGRLYRGANVVSLWAAAAFMGYRVDTWATYRQWGQLGAQVRKGEQGTLIVFYKTVEREQCDAENDDTVRQAYLLARASWVFNADQVDDWAYTPINQENQVKVLYDVDAFITRTRADIRYGGSRAYYAPVGDYIRVPHQEHFVGSSTSSPTEAYYSTLLHELTHWSGHRTRLNRDLTVRFGDEAYAMEELIAELGAAFLCGDLGITNAPRPDHAAYLSGWLRVLKADTRAFFMAASRASAAAQYLTGLNTEVPMDASPTT